MMKNLIKTFCFVLFIASFHIATADVVEDSTFQQANSAYQAGNYVDAEALYRQIVDAGNEGSVLFYNLGNACYKNDNKAHALLWYERALRLDPSNEDIKHNISFVNNTLVDKIEMMPEFVISKWWNDLSKSMVSNTWAICSIVLCFILFALIALILFAPRQWIRSGSFILSFVVLLLLILSIIFARKESVRHQNQPEAIIIKSVVTAKSTPNRSGADLFIIHEGLKVGISDKVSEWYEIRLPNGEKGWVTEGEVVVI